MIRFTHNGSPEGVRFCDGFALALAENERKTREWAATLRKDGVKMAHPDDGWVNRQKNELLPCYPYFDNGVEVGDSIVLGTHEKSRKVRVTGVRVSNLFAELVFYRFEETKNEVA